MELRLGIVGCGRISHAHGIAAQRANGVRWAACADINEASAQNFAATYGSNRTYTDYREMLATEELDGVVFATWPAQHREQLEAAIKSGVRYILCEKALAMTAQEATEIWDMAEANGTTIVEAFMYTHHPVIEKLDQLVARPESGQIDSVRGTFHLYLPEPTGGNLTWRQRKETGGSVPYDRACYPINACARYAKSLPVRVSASATVSEQFGTITRLYGMITYENGCVGVIESSNTAIFSQELEVTCSNRVYHVMTPFTMAGDGRIREWEALKFSHVREHVHEVPSDLPLQDDLPTYQAYTPQMEHFVSIASGKPAPAPSLIDSVVNTFTLDALVESGLQNRTIDIELPQHIRDAWKKHHASGSN